MGKLVHFHADGTAVEIRLDRQRITIGRRPDNDLCLPYPAVSGEHAAVVTILADSFLEDLGSTNGTLVNGAAVTKHFLRDRDQIDVGQQILTYVVDDAAAVERPLRSGRSHAGAAQDAPHDATLMPPAVLRAKRRSDVVAPAHVPSTELVDRVEVAEKYASFSADADAARAVATLAPKAENAIATPPDRRTGIVRALKVTTGAKAGRIVALVKDETLIGRAGVQVVALRRGADEIRVVPVEGASPPSVNGVHVVPEGQRLEVGDVLEVAGTRLEVVAAIERSSN